MRSLFLALPLLLAAGSTLLTTGCGKEDAKAAAPPSGMPPAAVSGDRAKDPICHMLVDKTTATRETYEGTNYYFCADECAKKFKAEPKKYAHNCVCGKVSKKCPCEHCGGQLGGCDCHQ